MIELCFAIILVKYHILRNITGAVEVIELGFAIIVVKYHILRKLMGTIEVIGLCFAIIFVKYDGEFLIYPYKN